MSHRNQRGQIVVEYVLILIVLVTIAGTLVKGIVGRGEDNPGMVIRVWNNLLVTIATDLPDHVE